MPFSTVFQSHQDDCWVIMKDCVQCNLVYGWRDYRLERGSKPGQLDQKISSQPTKLQRSFSIWRIDYSGKSD